MSEKSMEGMSAEERNAFEKTQLGKVGLKFDHGKPRMSLLSTNFTEGIAKVLTYGAEKYDADNWKRGMVWGRVYDAMQRHLTSWFSGEDCDPETGFSHLDHAGACMMFLRTYEARGIGEDNRESKVYERLEREAAEANKGSETDDSVKSEKEHARKILLLTGEGIDPIIAESLIRKIEKAAKD